MWDDNAREIKQSPRLYEVVVKLERRVPAQFLDGAPARDTSAACPRSCGPWPWPAATESVGDMVLS